MEENKLNIYNSNIIKWYPFEKEKNILQIGEKISIIDELGERKFGVSSWNELPKNFERKQFFF